MRDLSLSCSVVLVTWYLDFPIPLTMQIENFLPFGLPSIHQKNGSDRCTIGLETAPLCPSGFEPCT